MTAAGGFAHASREALLDAIRAARAGVAQPLLPRRWVPAGRDVDSGAEGRRVKIMQFNILAEGLSSRATDPPPFPDAVQTESDCGGFTNVPRDVFDYNVRRYLILEEIVRADPDIVALEECDHFADFFLPALRLLGYTGHFCQKKSSPCVRFGYHSDGVALFWRDAAFDCTTFTPIVAVDGHSDQQCCIALATLVCRASSEAYVIAATHLKAKATQENEDLRAAQVRTLLRHMQAQVEAVGRPHVVVLGDFNTAPHDELGLTAKAVPAVLAYAPVKFVSAYPLDLAYTTTKIRGEYVASHVIDYIFASASLHAAALLEVPPLDALDPKVLLPCRAYPSDHVSLAAEFICAPPREGA